MNLDQAVPEALSAGLSGRGQLSARLRVRNERLGDSLDPFLAAGRVQHTGAGLARSPFLLEIAGNGTATSGQTPP